MIVLTILGVIGSLLSVAAGLAALHAAQRLCQSAEEAAAMVAELDAMLVSSLESWDEPTQPDHRVN